MISVFEQESIDLTKLDPDVDQFKVNYYKSWSDPYLCVVLWFIHTERKQYWKTGYQYLEDIK